MLANKQGRHLLKTIRQLHEWGYERIRVAPYFADSPGGGVWRCEVVPDRFTSPSHVAARAGLDHPATFTYKARAASNYKQQRNRFSMFATDCTKTAARALLEFKEPLRIYGAGPDPGYAAWYAGMIEATKPDGLIYLGESSGISSFGPDDYEELGIPVYYESLGVCSPSGQAERDSIELPPPVAFHDPDRRRMSEMLQRNEDRTSQAPHDDNVTFFDEVIDVYSSCDEIGRAYLRSAVKATPAAFLAMLSDDVLSVRPSPCLATARANEKPAQHFLRILYAFSLTDGFPDSRQTLMALAELWNTAEEQGVDPAPLYQQVGEISSPLSEHTHGGPMQLMILRMLNPERRDRLLR